MTHQTKFQVNWKVYLPGKKQRQKKIFKHCREGTFQYKINGKNHKAKDRFKYTLNFCMQKNTKWTGCGGQAPNYNSQRLAAQPSSGCSWPFLQYLISRPWNWLGSAWLLSLSFGEGCYCFCPAPLNPGNSLSFLITFQYILFVQVRLSFICIQIIHLYNTWQSPWQKR